MFWDRQTETTPPPPLIYFGTYRQRLRPFFPSIAKKRIVRLWNYRESVEITRDVLKQYGQGLLLIISFPLTYLPTPPLFNFWDRQTDTKAWFFSSFKYITVWVWNHRAFTDRTSGACKHYEWNHFIVLYISISSILPPFPFLQFLGQIDRDEALIMPYLHKSNHAGVQ